MTTKCASGPIDGQLSNSRVTAERRLDRGIFEAGRWSNRRAQMATLMTQMAALATQIATACRVAALGEAVKTPAPLADGVLEIEVKRANADERLLKMLEVYLMACAHCAYYSGSDVPELLAARVVHRFSESVRALSEGWIRLGFDCDVNICHAAARLANDAVSTQGSVGKTLQDTIAQLLNRSPLSEEVPIAWQLANQYDIRLRAAHLLETEEFAKSEADAAIGVVAAAAAIVDAARVSAARNRPVRLRFPDEAIAVRIECGLAVSDAGFDYLELFLITHLWRTRGFSAPVRLAIFSGSLALLDGSPMPGAELARRESGAGEELRSPEDFCEQVLGIGPSAPLVLQYQVALKLIKLRLREADVDFPARLRRRVSLEVGCTPPPPPAKPTRWADELD